MAKANDAAFQAVIEEALGLIGDPDARCELTLRVRTARPAPLRDITLLAVAQFLAERRAQALKVAARIGVPVDWPEVYPELPPAIDVGAHLVEPVVGGV